ncbi:Putative neuroendocrine convertase 2 [Gryllus bimaculatus]|nr:Putative neuroendocrine convertase 2 [Gryllus bimaculatus]
MAGARASGRTLKYPLISRGGGGGGGGDGSGGDGSARGSNRVAGEWRTFAGRWMPQMKRRSCEMDCRGLCPSLTWRDIQHLTVLTSKRNSLFDAKGRFHWTMNGVGLEFNHLFGFGVLDAGAMVALATQWKTVPARFHCEGGSVNDVRYFHTGLWRSGYALSMLAYE